MQFTVTTRIQISKRCFSRHHEPRDPSKTFSDWKKITWVLLYLLHNLQKFFKWSLSVTFFVKYSRLRPASCFVEVESWDRPFRLSRALPGSGKVEIKEKLKIRYFDNLIFQKSHYSIMSTSSFSRSRQLRGFSSGHPESLGHRCWCSVVLVRAAQADRDAPRAPGETPEQETSKFRFSHISNNSWWF